LRLRATGNERKLKMDFADSAHRKGRTIRSSPAGVARSVKKLRVLALMHADYVPPDDQAGHSAQEIHDFKTEYHVCAALRTLGHEVQKLGVRDELQQIRVAIEQWKPDIVFNLLEEFRGEAVYDLNVTAFLELLGIRTRAAGRAACSWPATRRSRSS
jgi:hypothetical protein